MDWRWAESVCLGLGVGEEGERWLELERWTARLPLFSGVETSGEISSGAKGTVRGEGRLGAVLRGQPGAQEAG